jgi:hypothetical protein
MPSIKLRQIRRMVVALSEGALAVFDSLKIYQSRISDLKI